MSQSLYRAYRPQKLSDVVGQQHVVTTIMHAIEQHRIAHAYLFCGPRGTGKTTMARLVAKSLLCEQGPYCEPCGVCSYCERIARGEHPDVVEIDAASRTGVESVRSEIISRVQYAATEGEFTIFIIDEAHMLSTPAFNALLKTLEEPPAHVVFILCTTDPQQVIETVRSRCQRFDFKPLLAQEIADHLRVVCQSEGFTYEDQALDLVAQHAKGGMRDALSALEQLAAFGGDNITLTLAQSLLGTTQVTALAELVEAIATRDVGRCFELIARLNQAGQDLAQTWHDLSSYLRDIYVYQATQDMAALPHIDQSHHEVFKQQASLFESMDRLVRALAILGEHERDMRASVDPCLTFELCCTRIARPQEDISLDALAERVAALEAGSAAGRSVVQDAESAVERRVTQNPTGALATSDNHEREEATHTPTSAPTSSSYGDRSDRPHNERSITRAAALSSILYEDPASAEVPDQVHRVMPIYDSPSVNANHSSKMSTPQATSAAYESIDCASQELVSPSNSPEELEYSNQVGSSQSTNASASIPQAMQSGVTQAASGVVASGAPTSPSQVTPTVTQAAAPQVVPPAAQPAAPQPAQSSTSSSPSYDPQSAAFRARLESYWGRTAAAIKAEKPSIGAMVEKAYPTLEGQTLVLTIDQLGSFHKMMLTRKENHQFIVDHVRKQFLRDFDVEIRSGVSERTETVDTSDKSPAQTGYATGAVVQAQGREDGNNLSVGESGANAHPNQVQDQSSQVKVQTSVTPNKEPQTSVEKGDPTGQGVGSTCLADKQKASKEPEMSKVLVAPGASHEEEKLASPAKAPEAHVAYANEETGVASTPAAKTSAGEEESAPLSTEEKIRAMVVERFGEDCQVYKKEDHS